MRDIFSREVDFLLKSDYYSIKSSSSSTRLNARVVRSDWTSPFITPI